MKALKLLNDACELITSLEDVMIQQRYYDIGDGTSWINDSIEELFRNVKELDGAAYSNVTDIAIRIMEHLIAELGWDKTDQPDSEWYSLELRDGIHKIILDALGVKDAFDDRSHNVPAIKEARDE